MKEWPRTNEDGGKIIGYIFLAVNGVGDSVGYYRISCTSTSAPETFSDWAGLMGSNMEDISDGLTFYGSSAETPNSEWTEPCWVDIPRTAYTLASWKYYALPPDDEEEESFAVPVKDDDGDEMTHELYERANALPHAAWGRP